MGQSTRAAEVRQITLEVERKYGLPEDTLYKMAGIESGYRPDAKSPVGAQGWFQFMPATAKEYGLTDPSDLPSAADAAGRKMRDLMKKHGGNLDYALVDYNGGGKAVTALKNGKPWAESAGYLEKFGRTPKAPAAAPLGEQFTSQVAPPLTQGPNATDLAVTERQRDNEFGGVTGFAGNLPRAVSLGFQTQNSVWNFYKDQAVNEQDGDSPLDWESPEAKETLARFPERHWGYLSQATTKEALRKREARLSEVMGQEEELGRMGLPLSLAGSVVGNLPDLPTLVGVLPGVGGAALMTKASRVSNALRMAGLGAASSVGYDYVAQKYQPTATPEDLYISAAFGAGFGGLGGAFTNPNMIRLREENLRLQDHGFREATAAMKKEIVEALLPSPGKVDPFTPGARDDFLKKIDAWAGGLGRTSEVPRMASLRNEPTIEPHPWATKGEPVEPAPGPFRGPAEPPSVEPPAAPKVPTSGRPWGDEWEAPQYRNRMGAKDILILPPLERIEDLASYMRAKSRNPDMVALVDRAIEAIDLKALKFAVIDPKTPRGKKLSVGGDMKRAMSDAFGAVMTPWNSRGDGIEMALRGHGWGLEKTGLNEETFAHELLHVATVYKHERISSGNLEGIRPEAVQAYKELDKLYTQVQKATAKMSPQDLPERINVNLKNAKEFISYGLTNRPFQDYLKRVTIPGERTTLWTKFTDGLRRMLGMAPNEANAYSRLIDLSEALIDKTGIEGKPRPATEAFEPGNRFVSAEDAQAATDAGISPVFGWGLGLEHRLGGAKVPAPVRNLAAKLFGTTVGYKNHAVVERNAFDDTTALAAGWQAETRKVGYAAFDNWFKEQKRPWHQKGAAFEEFGEQVSNFVRGFEGDYHPEVQRAGRKIQEVTAKVADHINNPAHMDGGVKRGLTEIEVLDEATGQIMLVGKLEKNPNYLPRKHDAQKWDEAVRTWGREAVEGWWARAYAKVHPERSEADAKKWAGWYMRTVEEAHLNRSADHLEEMMTGYDQKALLESLMRNGGFTEPEARDIIRSMFQKPGSDAGRTASSLRHRNHISETHTETWKNAKGEEVTMSLNDFIQTNAFDVMDSYYRRTASSVALANRLDIYKQADIGSLIDKATEKKFGSDISDADITRMKADLKFAVDRIQGIPQEEWTTFGKSMEMWRDFNVIRLMGGAVWNQVTELAQIVGTMGWKTTLAAIPELRALRRDLRTGKAPNDFLDHLENTIGGAGSEVVARLDFSAKDDWVRYKGDSAQNARLDKLDGLLKKGAKGILDYTGMTPVMVQQKRVHAIALTNAFLNSAQGKAHKMFTPERLAWMGMTEGDFKKLQEGIRAHTKGVRQGEYAKTADFDYKGFAAAEPELNSMLMNALHRETRRVIQENDLASMVPLMGTTLGKTVFQFMNFVIHGWNKSMLFAMNHRDFTTISTVLHASFFASLAYMGRTQLSALGMDGEQRQEFLDQRMAGGQIVANSFGRMAQASLLPQVYDTFAGPFTGTMFSGMRTTSDLSSFASNPTLQAVNGFLSLGRGVHNAFSDETQTTQRDFKAWAKLVPLNNVAPVSTFFNAMAQDFPTSDKEED